MIILCTSVFCHTHLSASVTAWLSQCVSDCWDVVSHVGKGEIWRLGCHHLWHQGYKSEEKKKKKNLVWVLYRKVAFVCTEPSHLCVSLCVQLSRDRQTDGWIRDRTTGLRSTLWDPLIRSKCLIYPRITSTSQNFRSFSFLLNICIICLQLKKQTMLIRYVHFLLAIQII